MRRLLLALLLVPFLSAPAHAADPPLPGLPQGAPAALYRAEPVLPRAPGWSGSEAFSRTSGTGVYDSGAFLWTDWLYDDHGAITAPLANPDQTAGSPSFGGYSYASPSAHANGADIFRAGVLRQGDRTVWRVDWTTLADPFVPIAVWAFDRDNDPTTGTSAWPAAAGVSSPGIDTALVMSARGARLIDAVTGALLATAPVSVSKASHSFVTSLPMAPTGSWRLRLVSGVANADGTALAPAGGALPGQTAVYNATFRARAQEPLSNSFWNDTAQASALTAGSVADFSQVLRWSDLAARRSTPEPRPAGWQTRWYVSATSLGEGLLTGPETISDRGANLLGRLLPYSVYVPEQLPARAPLTFLLHSLTQNHNQYAATTPRFVQQACEERRSVCVTTGGRGGDGFYVDEAQLDFWQVWHEVARRWQLDADRTVLSGYSMGGIGSNYLAMAHPDLFAKVVTLAGALGAVPELENLRWTPMYLAGGAADELVPVTVQRAEAQALQALGYRFRWLVHPATDHVAYELQDGFSDAAAFMGDARRETAPAHVTLRWSPVSVPSSYDPVGGTLGRSVLAQTQRPDLGVGTTGAYWMRSLVARAGVSTARVDAVSAALRAPAVTAVPSNELLVPGDPSPALVTQQTWTTGPAPALRQEATVDLVGVRSATLLLADAGLTGCATVTVTSDGPGTLTLQGPTGSRQALALRAGTQSVRAQCAAVRAVESRSLPVTGMSGPIAALVLLGLAAAARRWPRSRGRLS